MVCQVILLSIFHDIFIHIVIKIINCTISNYCIQSFKFIFDENIKFETVILFNFIVGTLKVRVHTINIFKLQQNN